MFTDSLGSLKLHQKCSQGSAIMDVVISHLLLAMKE